MQQLIHYCVHVLRSRLEIGRGQFVWAEQFELWNGMTFFNCNLLKFSCQKHVKTDFTIVSILWSRNCTDWIIKLGSQWWPQTYNNAMQNSRKATDLNRMLAKIEINQAYHLHYVPVRAEEEEIRGKRGWNNVFFLLYLIQWCTSAHLISTFLASFNSQKLKLTINTPVYSLFFQLLLQILGNIRD